jgi:hypothetical protein
LGVPLLAEVPLMRPLREGGDSGTPLVVSEPDAPASVALIEAAEKISRTAKSRVGKPLTIRPTGAAAPAAGNGHNGHGHEAPAGHGHEAPAGHDHAGHAGHDHAGHAH